MDPTLQHRWHSWAQGALGGSPDQVHAAALAAMRVVVDGGRQSEAIGAAKRAWQQAGNPVAAFSLPVAPVEAPAGSPHPTVARIDELATAEATRREPARSATVGMPGDREIAGTREPRANVLDPQAVLSQAREGRAPPAWRVFTKKRGLVRGFVRGTSADPDPLLVITSDGVVEYVHSKKPIAVVDFDSLSRISLQVSGRSFSDSTIVHLDVWLDLHYRDGRKSKWRSASFSGRYETIQAFIEAYGAHQTVGLAPSSPS